MTGYCFLYSKHSQALQSNCQRYGLSCSCGSVSPAWRRPEPANKTKEGRRLHARASAHISAGDHRALQHALVESLECDYCFSCVKRTSQRCHPEQPLKLWWYLRPTVLTKTSQPEGTFEGDLVQPTTLCKDSPRSTCLCCGKIVRANSECTDQLMFQWKLDTSDNYTKLP